MVSTCIMQLTENPASGNTFLCYQPSAIPSIVTPKWNPSSGEYPLVYLLFTANHLWNKIWKATLSHRRLTYYNLEQCTFSYLTHQIVTTSAHLDASLNHVCARSARVDSSGRGAGATATGTGTTATTATATGTQTTNGDTRHRWPGDKLYKFKDKIYKYTNTMLLLEHKTPPPKEVPTSNQGLYQADQPSHLFSRWYFVLSSPAEGPARWEC